MVTEKQTVFVIESDVAVGDSLRSLLESAGRRVEVYRSGKDFIQDLNSDRSGCLVLDLHISATSVFEFLRHLSAQGIELPVILITWWMDATIEAQAQKAGVVALLEKPLSDALLLEAIERAFERDSRQL